MSRQFSRTMLGRDLTVNIFLNYVLVQKVNANCLFISLLAILFPCILCHHPRRTQPRLQRPVLHNGSIHPELAAQLIGHLTCRWIGTCIGTCILERVEDWRVQPVLVMNREGQEHQQQDNEQLHREHCEQPLPQ